MKKTRVRFAPSPTGPLHMGGVRTALYNYLFAKRAGGDFILRIEDTDSKRFVPGAEQYIINSLEWCGIRPSEGVDENGCIVSVPSEKHPYAPYRQSERKPIYRQYAEFLVENGFAYYAFDSAEALELEREKVEKQGGTFIYNHLTRGRMLNSLSLDKEQTQRLLSERSDWTVRFKMPENRTVDMEDMIRGNISVNTATLDDKVLWKRADELPTYHLANVVDDHLMEISDVIRGEEWLPSLPLHYLLYEAFCWERPRFAHLPLLLKPVGNGKLSKRDGDKMGFPVFPLQWVNADGEVTRGYREDGYFPEAFVNMLALLGWNPGTEQEIFSLEELVENFSLDRVLKAGAKFNPEKAKWFNREYLRTKDDASLTELFMPLLEQKGIEASKEYVARVIALTKERAVFVKDFWTIASYLFIAPEEFKKYGVKAGAASEKPADPSRPVDPRAKVYDDSLTAPFLAKDVDKFWKEESVQMAGEALEAALKAGNGNALEEYIKAREWPMGKIMNCIRLALSGASSGLGIADIISFIGPEQTMKRWQYAKQRLG
ncbi:MAG: glutamate--tRNA ligase [Bacteroidales bacterium]|nr:glutamate--tRNA ligase [Bacteroidales bacterium]